MINAPATRRWVLGLAVVGSFMVALDALVVTTALTTIRHDLGASVAQLEWTVNAYNLTLAVALMTASTIGDRFGRRRLFAVGMTAFSLASAACALAPNVGLLIAARAVQGLGAAFVVPLSVSLVGAAFPAERRGRAMGALQGLTGLAIASGPVIGGAIAQGIAWPWIFWINVPIGLLSVPLILTRIPESHGGSGTIDLPGVGLITGAALGLVWGLVRGNVVGWGSAEVVVSLVAGMVLLVGFVIWEARTATPMVPLRLFASRAFASGNVASFLAIGSLYASLFFVAQFIEIGLGYEPFHTGLRLLPWTATVFFVAPLAGVLVDRIGERPLLVVGLCLQGIGMAWVALLASPDVSYWQLVPGLMVAGSGISMALPAAQNAVVSSVEAVEIGTAAGVNSTLRQLGGVFGIAIAVAVFSATGGYASGHAFSDGFVAAMAVSAGLALLGAIIGLAMPQRRQTGAVAPGTPLIQGS